MSRTKTVSSSEIGPDPLNGETPFMKTKREAHFPLRLLLIGMHIELQNGKASVEEDRKCILQCIAKSETGSERDGEITLQKALQRANSKLHSFLAQVAWPQACKRGMVERFDLPSILKQDTDLRSLELSLAHDPKLKDQDMAQLARGLPQGLAVLKLSFEGCSGITSDGVGLLAQALPPTLQSIELDFVGCRRVTDLGVEMLAERLNISTLRNIRLDFAACEMVGMNGLRALAKNLPN